MEAIATEAGLFPAGRSPRIAEFSPAIAASAVAAIEGLPRKLIANVSGLSPADWERTWRAGSWTVRQIAHHIVDANLNNYARFKSALAEDEPVIRPHREDLWAELPDARSGDPRPALDLLTALHTRWVQAMRAMGESEWRRSFRLHDAVRPTPLFEAVAQYAWHGEHHLGQIRRALAR